MKKVFKKFNRTLSIMLAAAMVLTMVPQTAMPVLAEEPEITSEITSEITEEPQASEVVEDENSTTEEASDAEEKEEESTDVGEIKNPENSGVSDPSGDEQIDEEGGDTSDEDMVTEETPAEVQEEQETVTEESEDVVIEDVETEDESPALKTAADIETDSLVTPAETKILIKGVTTDSEGKETLADLSTADVYFTNGCASDDGATVRDNVDITFRVLAKDGSEVSGVTYAADASEDNLTLDKATNAVKADADGVYTIGKTAFTTNNKNDKNVLIVVKTAEIKYTVKTGRVAAGVTVNTVNTEGTTTTLTAVGSGAAFDYSKANAITLAMTGMDANKTYTVTAQASGSDDAKPLTAGSEGTAGETKYIPYILNVSELDGVDKANAQEITVTVTEVQAVTVAASAIDATDGYDATIAAATIPDTVTGYVAYKTGGDYTVGDKVAFTITPAANSNWAAITKADITAELVNGNEDETVEIAASNIEENPAGIEKPAGEGAAVYAVAIPADVESGYTLKIYVNAQLDSNKSKTITFAKTGNASSEDVVTIRGGESENPTDVLSATSVRTVAGTYYVDITSREGYQLQDVKVEVTGTYNDNNNTAYTDTYTLDQAEYYGEEGHEDVESTYPRYRVNKGIQLSGTGTVNNASATWTASTVTVTVDVAQNIEGADEEKQVTFGSGAAASYGNPYSFEVKTSKDDEGKDLVKYEEDEDPNGTSGRATIAEGVQYLEFSVAAETEPEVELKLKGENDEAETDGLLELVSNAPGNFEYRVAAKALIGDEGHISITRQSAAFTAEIPGRVASVTYENTENEKNEDQSGILYSSGTRRVDINAPLDVTVEPGSDVPIKSVSYQVGEAAAQTATPDSEGNYFFQVKATEDVTVTVERVEDERLFVTNVHGVEVEVAPDSVVEANYEDTINAYLLDADGAYIDIIRATVYDGPALAETKASVAGNVASFKVEKNEYARELTIELMKADRTTVSFKVISDTAVEGDITYTDNNGETVTSASLNADTSLTLHVNAKEGTVGKLDAKVIPTPATLPETVPENAAYSNNSLTMVDLSDGALTITAAALKDKVDDAGTILIFDPNDGTGKVLGSLKVSVQAPIMKGQTASVTPGLSDGRTVSIKIDVPDEVKSEQLEEGVLGYEVKVTAPDGLASMAKPDGWTGTDAEWNETRANAVANLGAAGGFVGLYQIRNYYTIRVIDNDKKPAKIDGIKITATPVQYTTDAEMTDANKISGTASSDVTMGTTAPLYSDTLKLGKGESSLTTGRDADIIVARPVFGANTQYKRVYAEIIDSSTGSEHANANDFYAAWNPVDGTVTVNAEDASYSTNAGGGYKNLAVKVTAFTEDGDYGVSGVKKLSVVNGIQDLDLTIQPEILFTGKKVTAKSAITYNTDSYGSDAAVNKKMAPKKKTVTYRMVGANSSWDEYDGLSEDAPSANLTAAVDNKGTPAVSVNPKNGQITVAAGFTFGKNNTFQVLAEAADYEGNQIKALSGPITIIGENTTLGELAVFESGSNGWRNAKKVTGDLQVKSTSNQYRLAMLKPGMANKPNGYNLNSDIMDYSLFDVKSSSAKNIEVSAYGYITVKKLGKTNFTMAAKSNSKNKADLKNVNFVMESTQLYVELNRYQDSTFKNPIDTAYYNANAAINITGNTTGYFSVNLVKREDTSKEISEDNRTKFALANCTFSFKNAKKVTPIGSWNERYTDDAYFVATGSTGNKATVLTVNNKGVKPAQKFTITISNETAPTGNAPKLALADKKQRIVADDRDNDVQINVTAAKKGEVIPADTYVMLSADQTKKTKANVNNVFDGYLDTPIRLNKTGDNTARFTVGMATNQAESYTLIATLGTLQDGVFTQTHKEARITLKAVKPNYNIKATGKYTLNPYGASSAKLVINGGDNDVEFYGYNDEDEYDEKIEGFNYAKNVIQKDGTPNEFNKYFVVTADVQTDWDGYEHAVIDRIMINPALTALELKNLEDKDFVKANATGYITVTNGSKTVDVKLTITVKQQKDMKPKAVVTPVIEGTNVITDIQITDGKNPVALAAYSAEGTSFKAYYTDAMKSDAVETAAENQRLANGIIRMQAATAARGYDPITLKVLLADTAAAYRVLNATTNPTPLDNGVEIKNVKVTIAANTTANKVVVAKNDQKWVVKRTEWNTWPTDGGTFYGWHTDVNYSFKNRLSAPAGQTIEVKSDTDYVNFSTDPYSVDGKGVLYIDLDKAKLTTAIDAPRSKVGWGKSVKVKATFSYPGTAAEGQTAADLFKQDTVTFTITLPEKEGYESADALKAAVDANRAALQNFVDKKTAEEHYWATNDENGNYHVVANDVADLLRNEVLDMAKGTTAEVTATGAYSNYVYTYRLSVGGTAVDPFVVRAETPTASEIKELIEYRYGTLFESSDDDKKTAEDLGLTLNPKTQAGDLTAKLREILDNEHYMTRNISLSVSDIVYDEITTEQSGDLTAKVVIRDSNVEPHRPGFSETATISYTFNQLVDVTDFADASALATALTDTNDDGVANMTPIFSDAYIASNGDIDMTTHKTGDTMNSELIKGIKKFAGDQIGNPYLSVKDIDTDSFKCEWDNANSKWTLAFKMTYTDETPGTETPEIPVEITAANSVEILASAVKSFQSPAQLKNDAEAAFTDAHYLIKNVTEPADAIAAVTELITGASINPTYDADASLSVTIVEPVADNFTAPTADMNGMVKVRVIYNNDTENKDQTGDYTFVIVKDDKLLGDTTEEDEEGNETTTPNLNDHDKAVDLVKAALTADKLNTIVKDVWEAHAAENFGADDTNLVDAVKTAVTEALTAGKVTTVELTSTVTPVTIASITIPTGSTGASNNGTFGIVTVNLKDTDATAEGAWTDAEDGCGKVEIPQVTLEADELFQNEDEFIKYIKDELAITGIPYDASYFSDGAVNEAAIDTIITGINAVLDEMTSTNPLYASYTKTAAKSEDEGHKTAVAATGTGLTNVKLTYGSENTEEYVPVRLLKEDEMSLVKSVKIDLIGSQSVTGEHNTEATALEVTGDGSTGLALHADVDVTTGANGEQPKVEWTLATKGENDSNMDGASAGVKKIVIEDGSLVIPDDAYADGTDSDVVLKLTATADGEKTGEGSNTDTIFIKIDLTESVTGIKLTNKNASDEDEAVLTTFEAPESGDDVTYTYKAVPVGKHVKTDTAAVFDEVTIEGDSNVKLERQSETSEMLLTVKAGAADHSGSGALKLNATVTDSDAKLDVDTITIKANDTAKEETALSLGDVTDEADYEAGKEGSEGTPATANTLTVMNGIAKAVEIPINFDKVNSNLADRDWNLPTIAVETAGQSFTSIDNDEITVKEGEGKDAGKFFLVVDNSMPEIALKQDADTETGAEQVDPLVLKLTATSNASEDNSQAAVTVDLTFEIVVKKTITGVKMGYALSEDGGATDVTGTAPVEITKAGNTNVWLKATVEGAHVDDTDDQAVTWKITSKGAKSEATIGADGKLTIPAGSTDNIIKVKATSTVDKTKANTITIKVK